MKDILDFDNVFHEPLLLLLCGKQLLLRLRRLVLQLRQLSLEVFLEVADCLLKRDTQVFVAADEIVQARHVVVCMTNVLVDLLLLQRLALQLICSTNTCEKKYI